MKPSAPKIMVVDDDEEFTKLYKEYLKMVGFEAVGSVQMDGLK